jgi:hypothetical protein
MLRQMYVVLEDRVCTVVVGVHVAVGSIVGMQLVMHAGRLMIRRSAGQSRHGGKCHMQAVAAAAAGEPGESSGCACLVVSIRPA